MNKNCTKIMIKNFHSWARIIRVRSLSYFDLTDGCSTERFHRVALRLAFMRAEIRKKDISGVENYSFFPTIFFNISDTVLVHVFLQTIGKMEKKRK